MTTSGAPATSPPKRWRTSGRWRLALDAALPSFALAAAIVLLVRTGVTIALVAQANSLLPGDRLLLLESPLSYAAVATSSLFVGWRRQRRRAAWLASGVAAGAALTAWTLTSVASTSAAPVVAMVLAAALPATAILVLFGGSVVRRLGPFPSALGLVLLGVAGFLYALSTGSFVRGNRLGLVSGSPGQTVHQDYSHHPLKDDYPPAVIRNNSLGYRDVEPGALRDGRRRVLLVGDSYVWGDGIPTQEDTLSTLLRAELDRAAPGAWDVVSAAYPGLGAYGYRRAFKSMLPEVRPDVVVVGYLGDPDIDPLDYQALHDLLPQSPAAAKLAVELGGLQSLHETAMALRTQSTWAHGVGETARDQLLASLAQFGRTPGHRAILLCYGGPERASDVEVLPLPEPWRYRGHRSELWYAKDSHPKPALNRKLAGWLGAELVQPGFARALKTSGAAEPSAGAESVQPGPAGAPGTSAAWVIPPGQEAFVLSMLGGTAPLHGCRLESAAVQRSFIEASYACEGASRRTLRLSHPADAPAHSIPTEQFAIEDLSSDAPAGFLAAVVASVRARESAFRWLQPEVRAAGAGAGAAPVKPARRPWMLLVSLAGAALFVVVASSRSGPDAVAVRRTTSRARLRPPALLAPAWTRLQDGWRLLAFLHQRRSAWVAALVVLLVASTAAIAAAQAAALSPYVYTLF